MRRKDKAITDRGEIDDIISRSLVCRLALSRNNTPYVIPLCFGYDGEYLYFHSAGEGTKIDILRENPDVAFEFDTDCEAMPSEKPCAWSMKYRSVVGSGRALFVEDAGGKRDALDIIFSHYSGQASGLDSGAADAIAVFKVRIREMTGKKSRM
jgi:nitroimidazol reductase NimA-like FMN-containing flavoprotein (pyridoxamine 5'-phosphate oxidase superfamily)